VVGFFVRGVLGLVLRVLGRLGCVWVGLLLGLGSLGVCLGELVLLTVWFGVVVRF
jgi:hypothetical protein